MEILDNTGDVLAVLDDLLRRTGDLSEPMAAIAAVMESAAEGASIRK